jgi:hypothetical protein
VRRIFAQVALARQTSPSWATVACNKSSNALKHGDSTAEGLALKKQINTLARMARKTMASSTDKGADHLAAIARINRSKGSPFERLISLHL